MHVESSYLQGWLAGRDWSKVDVAKGFPWRLSTRHGSNGVLGDLGCHIYDFTALLAGDVAEIYCNLKAFDKFPGNKLDGYALDANDSFIANVRFANGAVGTVHSTRWATGHSNSLRARVFGDKGAVMVDLDKSWGSYWICTGPGLAKQEWKEVTCRRTPNNYERFVRSIRTGINDPNDFANGARIQACLDASIRSNEKGGAVKVK
jgi:predicted dehydrogenase